MWQFSRGGRGPRRRMPRARHPGHRRQRLVLQPDRRPADLPDARRRRARHHRRRRPPHPVAAGRTPARTSTSSASPRPSSTARRGPAPCTATSAAARRRSTSRARSASPSCCTRHPQQSLISSAHDLSPAASRRRSPRRVMRFGVGARVWLDEIMERDGVDAATALFSESTGRVIVTVPREDDVKFRGLCEGRGYPVLRIGVTDCRIRRRSRCRACSPLPSTSSRTVNRARSPTRSARSSDTEATAARIGDGDPRNDAGGSPTRPATPPSTAGSGSCRPPTCSSSTATACCCSSARTPATTTSTGPRRPPATSRRASPCSTAAVARGIRRARRRHRRRGPRAAHHHAPHRAPGLAVDQRVDFFFACRRWTGTPALQEDKAADLRWFALDALPADVVHHERFVLDGLRDGASSRSPRSGSEVTECPSRRCSSPRSRCSSCSSSRSASSCAGCGHPAACGRASGTHSARSRARARPTSSCTPASAACRTRSSSRCRSRSTTRGAAREDGAARETRAARGDDGR